jgi:ABC-type ATPase involved in cell division
MVELHGVSQVYTRMPRGRVEALVDVSLEVKPGETVALVGPGGAGKTTLLRLVTGEARATRGSVVVLEEDVGALNRQGLARLRRELGVVSQDRRLLADRTVFGNVSLVLRALGHPRAEARARALEALDEVGLAARRNAAPTELAEADRLRLCLARALAPEPRLLLLDEPAPGLDAGALGSLVDLLRRRREHGATVLLATQAADLAVRLDARRLVLDQGRLRAEGGAD